MFQKENSILTSPLKIKQIPENLDDVKILQKENLKLKSQLKVKQKQLENLGDAKAFNDLQEEYSRLKSLLQSQSEKFEAHADKLKEENSKLATRLMARQKLFTDVNSMKVHTNVLQEENLDLKSQLQATKKQLKKLKDKERCDIAIQTDMVCTYVICS